MKIKQTIMMSLFIAAMILAGMVAAPVQAASTDSQVTREQSDASRMCGSVKTSIIGGSACGNVKENSTNIKESGVWALLILTLNILTAGVGIAAVGGIAYGAALYASSADKPDQAKAGMTFIKNVVIGLIAYALMFIILNFLIPGGLFS